MWLRVFCFLTMCSLMTSQLINIVPVPYRQRPISAALLRTEKQLTSEEGDGNQNACLASVFPCNVTSEFCCFMIAQNYENDDEEKGEEEDVDLNLAWCCSFEDGCGAYPYTCGDYSNIAPSLNITAHSSNETKTDV